MLIVFFLLVLFLHPDNAQAEVMTSKIWPMHTVLASFILILFQVPCTLPCLVYSPFGEHFVFSYFCAEVHALPPVGRLTFYFPSVLK